MSTFTTEKRRPRKRAWNAFDKMLIVVLLLLLALASKSIAVVVVVMIVIITGGLSGGGAHDFLFLTFSLDVGNERRRWRMVVPGDGNVWSHVFIVRW